MNFYIKKYTANPGRFTPHYNRELGKYYDTKREYFSDLKSRGLEPYNPDHVAKRKPMVYKPSQWAKDVARTLERNGLTGSVRETIMKNTKIKNTPKSLADGLGNGGFF